jgi:hypothetical protein
MPRVRPRTYVAAPVAVLLRPDWPERVRQVASLVGPVWDLATLFESSTDWLNRWPGLLPTVTRLVLVPDDDGSIGAGCLREIADVLGRDLPVSLYDGTQLRPWGAVVIRTVSTPSRFRVATVVTRQESHRRTIQAKAEGKQ